MQPLPAHDWSAPLVPSDILILTLYHPVQKFAQFAACDYGAYLHANRFAFATKFGYQYLIDSDTHDSSRPRSWRKVLALARALTRAEADGPPPKYVMLMDADALFTRFKGFNSGTGDGPLERVIAAMGGADVGFGEDRFGLNAGVGMFRATPATLRLLRDVYATLEHLNAPWWEQKAYMELLTGESARPEHTRILALLPQRLLNSYPPGTGRQEGWWGPGDLVLHFAGSKNQGFARRVEAGLGDAAPSCAAGREEAVWIEIAAGAVNGTADAVTGADGAAAPSGHTTSA